MNIYTHLTSLKQNVVQKMIDVQVNRFQSEERKTRIRRHTGESKMGKIEVGKLKIDDLCIFTEPEYRLYSVEFFSNISHPDETDSIDCGTNEDLFLALAALRDDTDKFQWFISPEGIWAYNTNNDSISVSPKWRKATVNELIEHFKIKEE